MQILLFLSALLTAFTGMMSGERVIEQPQVERAAAGTTVDALAVIAAPVVRVSPQPFENIANFPAAFSPASVQDGAVRAVLLVNGSRLE